MATFYIDFENVHNSGLRAADKLGCDDTIVIFYRDNDTVAMPQVISLLRSEACVTFKKVRRTTPNALDFQLLAELLCTTDRETQNYIVSKDRGYDSAIDVARHHGVKLRRCDSIEYVIIGRKLHANNEEELSAEETDDSDVEAVSDETDTPDEMTETSEEEILEEETESACNDAIPSPEPEVLQEESADFDVAPAEEETISEEEASCDDADTSADAVPVLDEIPAEEAPAEETPDETAVPADESLPEEENTQAEENVAAEEQVGAESPESSDEAPVKSRRGRKRGGRNRRSRSQERQSRSSSRVEQLRAAVPEKELSEEQSELILRAAAQANNKQRFYQNIVKEMGAEKGLEFYRSIKDSYSTFKEISDSSAE